MNAAGAGTTSAISAPSHRGRSSWLAVPVTTTVAGLFSVLVSHAVPARRQDGAAPGSGWVLQRLGEAPFELSGTRRRWNG